MNFRTQSGLGIAYRSRGQGRTMVLLHPVGLCGAFWDPVVAELENEFRLITPDARGHGQSDLPTDPAAYSEAATVGDMKAILDVCGETSAVIGGLSLGGYMTLAFHLRHAPVCKALMLFDTGPGFKKDEAREAWNQRSRDRADDLEARGFAALGGSDEVRMSQHRSPLGLAGAARGMLAQENAGVIESLPSIAVPTLVLVGANDTNFLAATDYMAAKIPGAKKAIIPDAGHAANLHQPAAFNAAMGSFLTSLG